MVSCVDLIDGVTSLTFLIKRAKSRFNKKIKSRDKKRRNEKNAIKNGCNIHIVHILHEERDVFF